MKTVHVFVAQGKRVIVDDEVLEFDFKLPEVFTEDFYYLTWADNFHGYVTVEPNNPFEQVKHELEPTEENYQKYVQPFVNQFELEKLRIQPELELAQAKVERSEAVERITVEVDGMKFDGDETSQTRMGRTIAAAIALGVDIQTYTQVWVLADNTVAQVTISQLAQALKLSGEAQTALWTMPYEA